MLEPGLEPKDCPNFQACGSAVVLTPEEQVELIQARHEENERLLERIWIGRRQAAVMMLMSRGNPQNLEAFEVPTLANTIRSQLQTLEEALARLGELYIAPEGCEAHRYNVKRPGGTYWYNKLTSSTAMFEPAEKTEKVKVIHLSHDDDPRNEEGRLGVARRDRVKQIRTQLRVAEEALARAVELSNLPLEVVLADDINE